MAQQDPAAVFAQYDRNGSGGIEVDELKALLRDLVLLEGRSPDDATAFVAQQFALADRKTRDNRLDPAEFAAFYAKVTAPKLLDALAAELPEELAQLRRVFAAYASFGGPRGAPAAAAELDGARWIKLCREAGLVGRRLTTTDCDLAFAKCKERAARRVTFEQFLDALDLVAAKREQPLAEVVRQVAAAEAPALHGTTKAEAVRFHDDTSTYTGVYARRASAGSCGEAARRRSSVGTAGTGVTASRLTPRTHSGTSTGRAAGAELTPGVESRDALRVAFTAFATFGLGSSPQLGKAGAEMDSKQFAKLCRDAGLICRRLTTTAVDLAFTKAKPQGARKISFRQFRAAVESLAAEKGVPKEELFAQIAAASPTLNNVVTPEAVDAESGRLVAAAATGDSPTAAPLAGAAGYSGAAGEAAAAVEDSARSASPQEEEGAVGQMDKLSLNSGGRVVHISAVASSPLE